MSQNFGAVTIENATATSVKPIMGKALEPLKSGKGAIKVLVLVTLR